jgi:hypothetical protein
MHFASRPRFCWQASSLVVVGAALVQGCGAKSEVNLSKPEVNAASAAAKAMELYDASGDGALDKDELAKCPPLANVAKKYDADGDGRVSHDEIAARFEKLVGPTAAFATVNCTVTLGRRPLPGATVKLRPIDAFEGALPAAEGTTDEEGVAHPGISADALPPKLKSAFLVYPGLYHVEITHPQQKLPERYNTATELGFEVDPASREGAAARFDLQP